jgi:hypothetical protein
MSWRRVWISLALFGFSMFFILFQNFTSAYIKGFGQSYVFDNFELPTHSEAVWSLQGASCNQILHKDTADLYPTFGQTVRPGYCGFRTDKQTANTFLRFITHPFDRRDASKVTYQESVDHGKGGSETRGKPTFAFNKPLTGKSLDEGWDLGGDYYSTAENTIRYSFDFRVYNISIFEERLAQSATIAQFHQASKFGDKTCGPYYAGSAPSPGLYMSLNKDNSNLIDFKLSLKLFEDQIPSSLAGSKTNCLGQAPIYGTSGPTRSICEVLVWTESFNKTDVVGKWFSVSIIMKNAKAGDLEFLSWLKGIYFGSGEIMLVVVL